MKVKIPLIIEELVRREASRVDLEKVKKIWKLLENPPYIEINLGDMCDKLPPESQEVLKARLEDYLKTSGRLLILAIAAELSALDEKFEVSLLDTLNRGLAITNATLQEIEKELTIELIRRQEASSEV
jgi:hypothetical protein